MRGLPLAELSVLRAELARFDPSEPIARAWTPPASWYAAPAFHALDRDAVFGHAWQPVARVAEVAEPGRFASGCFAGRPWVVTRQSDGSLAAFHNVCLHKGREVVTGSGRAEHLVCGYHGWSYELGGRLRKAPRMAGIEGFDREAMSLRPMGVEVWGPWVFVNPDPAAAPLEARVADLDAMLRETAWARLQYAGSREWTLACNWKVYVDNYLDGGYHVPHMHPTLAGQLDVENYRTDLFGEYSVQSCPPAGTPEGARIGGGALYAWIFPNLMLNRYGTCLDMNHVIPVGPDACKVRYEFYFEDVTSDAAQAAIARSMAQSDVTQREDIEICESVQRGLASGAYDRGRYAPRVEQGEHHFHQLLHHAYAGALAT